MENATYKKDDPTLDEHDQISALSEKCTVGEDENTLNRESVRHTISQQHNPSTTIADVARIAMTVPLQSAAAEAAAEVAETTIDAKVVTETTLSAKPANVESAVTSTLPIPTSPRTTVSKHLATTQQQPAPPQQIANVLAATVASSSSPAAAVNNKKRKLNSDPTNSSTTSTTANPVTKATTNMTKETTNIAAATALPSVPPAAAPPPPTTTTTDTTLVPKSIPNSTTTSATITSSNSSSSAATTVPARSTGPVTPPLVDYPFVVQAVNDILALLQTYGALTYGQLEYNLPPLSGSGRLNQQSLFDILEILVAIGLVQKVIEEEASATRYCMFQGVPRADVVHPNTVFDQIESAHDEIKRCHDRIKRLETLLIGSSKATPPSHREVLKSLVSDYPEVLLDPVYVAALRNLHVDTGGTERKARVTTATAKPANVATTDSARTAADVQIVKPESTVPTTTAEATTTTTPTTLGASPASAARQVPPAKESTSIIETPPTVEKNPMKQSDGNNNASSKETDSVNVTTAGLVQCDQQDPGNSCAETEPKNLRLDSAVGITSQPTVSSHSPLLVPKAISETETPITEDQGATIIDESGKENTTTNCIPTDSEAVVPTTTETLTSTENVT